MPHMSRCLGFPDQPVTKVVPSLHCRIAHGGAEHFGLTYRFVLVAAHVLFFSDQNTRMRNYYIDQHTVNVHILRPRLSVICELCENRRRMNFLWQCHISGPNWWISQALSQSTTFPMHFSTFLGTVMTLPLGMCLGSHRPPFG